MNNVLYMTIIVYVALLGLIEENKLIEMQGARNFKIMSVSLGTVG